jgi:RNA polymerase sigma-70 factor (ECF subfamily)
MNPPLGVNDPSPDIARWFATTHWSVVLAAHDEEGSAGARALESLCRTYWYPMYAYVRRVGHSVEDARDLTQGFFADVLARKALGKADRIKGRFRSFLLACLKNYLTTEWDKTMTAKRGGGQAPLSLDEEEAEGRYRGEPMDEASPDKVVERRWALTVMEQALDRLRDEYAADGKAQLFDHLKDSLFPGESSLSDKQIAERLKATESTVRSWLHRLRRRYGELLRQIVADTVASPEEVEAELRFLISAVSQ